MEEKIDVGGNGVGPETPKSIEEHQDRYLRDAWHEYTLQELGFFVYFFVKRAGLRNIVVDKAKVAKDLTDAQNHLDMMQAKLNHAKGMLGVE
jgi:hypothetical protein